MQLTAARQRECECECEQKQKHLKHKIEKMQQTKTKGAIRDTGLVY